MLYSASNALFTHLPIAKARFLLLASILLACVFTPATADSTVLSDDFTHAYQDFNPWHCVNTSGHIQAPVGHQLIVDDSGNLRASSIAPSVAVGDLNGDGLPDIVMADSVGFFWYFRNQGTNDSPKFGNPEVMPVWLGDPCPDIWNQDNIVANNVVPRIQLIDFDGDGPLDLVVGNYFGKLFYLWNQGSKDHPSFKLPRTLDDITVQTQQGGRLWCNYLSPFLYDCKSNGSLALLIGDGSYSANSIYLLPNAGTNAQPKFNYDQTSKIIPGMGREHLVPQVISWNGDGKADILTAEREGFLDLFLNQGNDSTTGYPTFDQGHHIPVGGNEKMAQNYTFAVANLSNSALPGLVFGYPDGTVSYSSNIGQPGSYQFSSPVPIASTIASTAIFRPIGWTLDGGYGSPYDLLVRTDSKVESGFLPPPDTNLTTALRFYIDEPKQPNPTFPTHFYPALDTRTIRHNDNIVLQAGLRYKLTFWVRTDGTISELKTGIRASQYDSNHVELGFVEKIADVDASSSWSQFSTTLTFDSLSTDPHASVPFLFYFKFSGKGSLYLADIKLVPAH